MKQDKLIVAQQNIIGYYSFTQTRGETEDE